MPTPQQGFVTLDPNEVEDVATLPAMQPVSTHAASVRASGTRPEPVDPNAPDYPTTGNLAADLLSPNGAGRINLAIGAGKRLGQYAYNLGQAATAFKPLGLLEGILPDALANWQPVRGAQEELYGKRFLTPDAESRALVSSTWGLDDAAEAALRARGPVAPEGVVQETPVASHERSISSPAASRAAYGPFEEDLRLRGGYQKGGALATDLAAGLAINPELGLPAGVEAMIAAGSKGGKIARTIAKVPEAVNQAAVGAVYGQMAEQDPLAGAVFGGGTHMLIGGAKTPETIKAAADRWVESAKVRLGRALGPAMKPNKRFVEKHAEDIINEVDWLGTGGLKGLEEKLSQGADEVGQQLDAAMAAAKQGDVSSALASARRELKSQVGQLRLQANKQNILLAPKTSEALDHAADILNSVNPKDTNITSLRLAHQTINDAVYDMRLEIQRRVRQTRMGWVGNVIDSAIQKGVPQNVRNQMRGTRAGVESVMDSLAGTRTETQPILDAFETAKNAFRTQNAAGQWVENVPDAIREIEKLQSQVAAYGPEISANALWDVKKQWGNVVSGATGRGWYSNIADETRKGALMDATGTLRDTLTDLRPETKALNERYHLLKGTADVIGDTIERRTGQTGGLMKSVAAVGGGGAGLTTYLTGVLGGPLSAVLAAAVPVATTVMKSPEFNLLSAKTRLYLAGAVRRGSAQMIHHALQRVSMELMLKNEHGVTGPAAGGADLTDEEFQHELDKLTQTGATTPGITDRANPDAAYADAPSGGPAPPETPEEGILPGSSPADDPMPGDPDYVPGLDGPGVDPDLQARATTALGPRGSVSPAQYRASMADEGFLRRGLDFVQRPLVDPSSINIEGHPTLTRAAQLASQFTSPLDLAFGAEEFARPLAAGTRFAEPVTRAGRAVSATMGLAGLKNIEEGVQNRSPSQVVGGVAQAGFGGLGMRSRGLAGAAEEVGSAASRLGRGLRAAGTQAVVGPALSLSAQAIADTPMMRRLVPDDDSRSAVVSGLQILGLLGSGAAIGAAAYRDMTPTMKATTHAAGQLSTGRAERLVRYDIAPALEADVRAKFPSWSDEKVAAKVQTLSDQAITKARGALEEIHAASGGRALDPRAYERSIRPETRFFGDWYRGTKDMIREMVPAQPGEAVDANGLTSKQALAVDTLATFGTNTPPKQNYELYAEAANQINDAPPNLSRSELLQWTRENLMPGGELFGMDPDKPGIPSLRNIVTGKSEGFGGRKIESYGINLAEGTRPDITGKEVIPSTVDRWIYREYGLPTEIPERTGEPVMRVGPRGEETGLQRGGDRTRQRVIAKGMDEERFASETQRLMDQLTARAEARVKAGTGPPITPREIAAVEALAQRNAQQFEVPVAKQAHRSTAQGSKWLGQSLPGNASYEVIEQQMRRAGELQGLDPDQAQAMVWYRTRSLSNLTHGEAPEQGLPFAQQRRLAQTAEQQAEQVAETIPSTTPWKSRVAHAATLIEQRNEQLAQTLSADITGPDSGFSHNVAKGVNPGGNPLTAVSIYPERQVVVPRAVRARQGDYKSALASFIRDNADLLQDPNLAVGGWVVKAPTAAERRAGKIPMKLAGREVPEGSLVLDVVATPSNAENNAIAKSLGMEYLQDSVFDLEKFENVKTGGQSFAKGSPFAMRAAHERRPPVYQRSATELDPAQVPARLSALENDPRLTESQRAMLRQWRAERETRGGGSPTISTAAARTPRAPKLTPVEGVGDVVIKKGPDFSMDNVYHVTLPDGRQFPIYNDKTPGGIREWLVAGAEDTHLGGFTKEELIQKLNTLDESLPAIDRYSSRRIGKTIGELINRGRKTSGLPAR